MNRSPDPGRGTREDPTRNPPAASGEVLPLGPVVVGAARADLGADEPAVGDECTRSAAGGGFPAAASRLASTTNICVDSDGRAQADSDGRAQAASH